MMLLSILLALYAEKLLGSWIHHTDDQLCEAVTFLEYSKQIRSIPWLLIVYSGPLHHQVISNHGIYKHILAYQMEGF